MSKGVKYLDFITCATVQRMQVSPFNFNNNFCDNREDSYLAGIQKHTLFISMIN